MGQSVFANSKLISHKSSDGKAVVFPDVCKVPAPPAPPIPIPYPNTQYEENLKKANRADARAKKGYKIAQKQVDKAINSAYAASKGDEAGTSKGIISSNKDDQMSFARGVTTLNIESATQAVMLGFTLHKKYNGK